MTDQQPQWCRERVFRPTAAADRHLTAYAGARSGEALDGAALLHCR
jgi:hypothetical protein